MSETVRIFDLNSVPRDINIDEEGRLIVGSIISDENGNAVTIQQNEHTGNYELLVKQENHICIDNTTVDLLLAGETFTGVWQEHLNYHEINVSVSSDQNSAVNGLVFQWSSNGVDIEDTDSFTVYGNAGTNYTPNPAFRYVRITYTNGAVNQTRFSLMTILRKQVSGGSFHRIDSTLKDDSDGRLVVCVPKLRTAANNYVSQGATANGNTKVSLEEFETAVSDDTKTKLKTSPYCIDEFDVVARLLGDNIFRGALVAIPPEHHEIHCGDRYSARYTADLGNGASMTFAVIVPNEGLSETNPGEDQTKKQYHAVLYVDVEAEATVIGYEGATLSNNGTAIPVGNRNRNSSNVDYLGVYHTPTVTTPGNVFLSTIRLGSGKTIGGKAGRGDEFILKDNTIYLFTVTNATTSNNYFNIELDYYVHPGV